ncbi:hypothetical protein ACIRCZ_03130 [Leifsonia sp. NPDC102414]|uniref:hypothetical protein n=1 Tax=Leifsonia sp. NPDC102414 TaxID=3364124 RepID=UPI003815E15C
MPKEIQLPPYPASGGPAIANQTDTYRGRYRQRISDIHAELAACEAAFERALAQADAAEITRGRIDNLAARAKRNARR